MAQTTVGDVHFGHRFYTGDDGHVYVRLRPNDLYYIYFTDGEIATVNENMELVMFQHETPANLL